MSQKSNSDLTAENASVITGQTTPESITPTTAGTFFQDLIDSMFNKVDDNLLYCGISMTKAELATAIGLSTLKDQQQITITDRSDTYPLIVFAKGTNQISPFGIWVKGGKPLAVIMDYVSGYQGETNPFIAWYDENRKLNLSNQIIIADGSQSVGYELVCDANGKSTWKAPRANFQGNLKSPGGTTGAAEMAGLNATITPTRTGKIQVIISGEYTSSDTSGLTSLTIWAGGGSPPSNGDSEGAVGAIIQSNKRTSIDATKKQSFSFNCVGFQAVGTSLWVDVGMHNAAGGAVQLYNVSVSLFEI